MARFPDAFRALPLVAGGAGIVGVVANRVASGVRARWHLPLAPRPAAPLVAARGRPLGGFSHAAPTSVSTRTRRAADCAGCVGGLGAVAC